ncbi:unnamed protein product [Onchocerca flexuosa]|uniref:S ribonuclease n=1 Tax=Onchocerca flexuosa TaxID=387005 RepID=A0A183GY69_9BILA|nr:unnamed protein product [Onchocerca flexuosa]
MDASDVRFMRNDKKWLCAHLQKQEVRDERRAEKGVIDESGRNRITGPLFQFEALPSTNTTSIAPNTSGDASVKMPDRKQNEDSGLQEVHRLLKKFNTVREQRAKKCIHEDMIAETDNRHDQDLMMQLQYQYVSRISIPHSHSSSDSGLHPLYKEKKKCLKNSSLSKGMNALELMESESQPISQKYHPVVCVMSPSQSTSMAAV